jgi:sugar/nucleoside kinase (ribokinase family)
MNYDIYLYGMTVLSTIHKLSGEYPSADSYSELEKTFVCSGGETMNAAMLLSGLGLKTRIDGPYWGSETYNTLRLYAEKYNIDISGIHYDKSFDGLRDWVIVDNKHRTVFGTFGKYFSDEIKRWTEPDIDAVKSSKIISIDPFFGESSEKAATYCVEQKKEYVTIDCPYDSFIYKNSAATVISKEFRDQKYLGTSVKDLLELYKSNSCGLVIFTSGKEPILYCRRDGEINSSEIFKVDVKSTLGAGDTFRAGVVFGLYNNWSDSKIVEFSSALAAYMCSTMPIADNIPSLNDIRKFIEENTVNNTILH